MEKKNRPLLWIVGAVLAVAGLVMGAQWLGQKNDERIIKGPDISPEGKSGSEVARAQQPPLSEALGVDETDFVEVGGVKRPKRDVAWSATTAYSASIVAPAANERTDYEYDTSHRLVKVKRPSQRLSFDRIKQRETTRPQPASWPIEGKRLK